MWSHIPSHGRLLGNVGRIPVDTLCGLGLVIGLLLLAVYYIMYVHACRAQALFVLGRCIGYRLVNITFSGKAASFPLKKTLQYLPRFKAVGFVSTERLVFSRQNMAAIHTIWLTTFTWRRKTCITTLLHMHRDIKPAGNSSLVIQLSCMKSPLMIVINISALQYITYDVYGSNKTRFYAVFRYNFKACYLKAV